VSECGGGGECMLCCGDSRPEGDQKGAGARATAGQVLARRRRRRWWEGSRRRRAARALSQNLRRLHLFKGAAKKATDPEHNFYYFSPRD